VRIIDPAQHPVPFVHQLLLSGVGPRPIALVATMDAEGRHNLSPFSFYNAFGANPPIVAVSPAFRGTDGTPKHTYVNILETREFTISAVSYAMLDQINLASSDYPAGVNEFIKAGFGTLPSVHIAPPGVAESPFVMECRLVHAYESGGRPGGGNLLIGEVVCFHVRESAYSGDKLDPRKLDLVARMGYNWYCRANGDALFELSKPRGAGVGIDALPAFIRDSALFTGSDLARFGSLTSLPAIEQLMARWQDELDAVQTADHGAQHQAVEDGGDPVEDLTAVQRDMRSREASSAAIAERLQACARRFLAAGNIERAVFCAFVSEAALVERLRQL